MKVKCTSDDRELILRVLQQETGQEAIYEGLPEFRYTVGRYWLLRSGYIEYCCEAETGSGSIPDAIGTLASLGLCECVREHAGEDSIRTVDPCERSQTRTEDDAPVCSSDPGAPVWEHAPRIPCYSLEGHSGRTLLNLFCIFSARQSLLNRALDARGAFFIARELMDDLLAHPPVTLTDFMSMIYGRDEEFRGIVFTKDRILLPGFREGRPDEVRIHWQLAGLILQAALTNRWTKPFTRNVRNKKYSFRIWLLSLGMIGPEYEVARQTLLGRLPGRSDQRKIPRDRPAFGSEV